MVSVPPMCTQATFWNLVNSSLFCDVVAVALCLLWQFRLPPQYVSFDESHPYPSTCPKAATGQGLVSAAEDPMLYEDSELPYSPILASSQGSSTHGR